MCLLKLLYYMRERNGWCTMKILVLSDSHSALRFMREAVRAVKPDAIVHLGDYYDDARVLAEENPHIPVHMVPGNCDRLRCPPETARTAALTDSILARCLGRKAYLSASACRWTPHSR